MPKLVLDMQDEKLKEEVSSLVTKIDYPLRFGKISIEESCKVDFLKGDANEDMIIMINPQNDFTKNRPLFRGYFGRFIFQLINDKEGINSEIQENLNCPRVVPYIQNFFADYRAAKHGFKKQMKQFFIEKVAEKVYGGKPITNKEFVEFYLYYIVMKKLKDGEELNSILMPIKPHGLDPLLLELEKLDYPFKTGDRALVKVWNQLLEEKK
jgi:hypothetical protein